MMRFFGMAMLAAALALGGCAGREALSTGPVSPRILRAVAAARVDPAVAAATLSAYRARHGLGPVRLDPALIAMAQRQAEAMVRANEMSHDVAGSFGSRLLAAGIDTPRAAENISGGYFSQDEAFAGWRESPAHNANLLMPQATRFGIAMAKDVHTRLKVYWAMEVAAPPDRGAPGPSMSTSLSMTPAPAQP